MIPKKIRGGLPHPSSKDLGTYPGDNAPTQGLGPPWPISGSLWSRETPENARRRRRMEFLLMREAIAVGFARVAWGGDETSNLPRVEPRWWSAILAGGAVEAALIGLYGMPASMSLALIPLWLILAMLWLRRTGSTRLRTALGPWPQILMLGWTWRASTLNVLYEAQDSRSQALLGAVQFVGSMGLLLFTAVAVLPSGLAECAARRILNDRAARRPGLLGLGDG